MKLRWGPGPVFAFESLAAARRWQVYALRSIYVALLLAGLTLTWGPSEQTIHSLAEAARIGQALLYTVIVVQLAVVLLAAPAATAGAICVDKARGTLHHAFVTDLTSREIVLGKLGARLAPILSLLAIGLPVLALGSFLGGIDLEAALGAELVTAGTAILCCTLAFLASVWARKPHQALLFSYALVGIWVGFIFFAIAVFRLGSPTTASEWFLCLSNPFFAALQPNWTKSEVGLREQSAFFVVTLLISFLLLGLASWRLRPTVLAQTSRPQKRERPDAPARLVDYIPGPSLDYNPVLWREWHRKRPSRWTGRFWTAYAIVFTLASLYVLAGYYVWSASLFRSDMHTTAALVNAWEVSIGLLLLSVSAATSLAEERDRGSLDVIMTTPLDTREIVWGKWWGTFAMVPRLAILPIWVSLGAAMITDGFVGVPLMIGMMLAYAAAITSLGLAAATWIPRLGRVVTVSVLAYVLVAAGWPLMMNILPASPLFGAIPWNQQPDWNGLCLASPFYGIYATTERACRVWNDGYSPWIRYGPSLWHENPAWPLIWIGIYLAIALLLALTTLLTFDRCLGRMTDTRRLPRSTFDKKE
ncbi:MAG: ABC transporter permease subunit [Isosphaeraceae bacterium]